jgi:hypothetical protein
MLWVAKHLESIGSELVLSNSACIGNSELSLWRIIQMIQCGAILDSGGGFFFAGRANGSSLYFFAVWKFDIVNSLSKLFWPQ